MHQDNMWTNIDRQERRIRKHHFRNKIQKLETIGNSREKIHFIGWDAGTWMLISHMNISTDQPTDWRMDRFIVIAIAIAIVLPASRKTNVQRYFPYNSCGANKITWKDKRCEWNEFIEQLEAVFTMKTKTSSALKELSHDWMTFLLLQKWWYWINSGENKYVEVFWIRLIIGRSNKEKKYAR